MTHFTLYSRSYCHLCEDMLHALLALKAEFAFEVTAVDVDADPELVARYDELVPVLVGSRDGRVEQLCHYFLDEKRVREFLTGVTME